jgi:hypothetical protein
MHKTRQQVGFTAGGACPEVSSGRRGHPLPGRHHRSPRAPLRASFHGERLPPGLRVLLAFNDQGSEPAASHPPATSPKSTICYG